MKEDTKARGLYTALDLFKSEMDEPICKLKLLENLCHTGLAFKEGLHGLSDETMEGIGHGLSIILREVRETYEEVLNALEEMYESTPERLSGGE
jgi:hypothetical protein